MWPASSSTSSPGRQTQSTAHARPTLSSRDTSVRATDPPAVPVSRRSPARDRVRTHEQNRWACRENGCERTAFEDAWSMTAPFSEIVTNRLRLVPFDEATARAVLDGDLTYVRAAEGWPQ